jgi:hypothetical protein
MRRVLTSRTERVRRMTVIVGLGMTSLLAASPLGMGRAAIAAQGVVSRTVNPPGLSQAQADAMLANASDPGLPSVVGSVNGWPIYGKELAQMEAIIASTTPNAVIGSPALRTEAFQAIAQQYVAEQTAQADGLYPSTAQALSEAQAEGLPTTASSLSHIQARDGMFALREQVLPANELNDATAWDNYLNQLLAKATVVEYPPLATAP